MTLGDIRSRKINYKIAAVENGQRLNIGTNQRLRQVQVEKRKEHDTKRHTRHLWSPLMSSCSSFALNILIQSTGIISLNPVKNALKAEEGREEKEKMKKMIATE